MSNRDFGTCCASCQLNWTCETKWHRGEKEKKISAASSVIFITIVSLKKLERQHD